MTDLEEPQRSRLLAIDGGKQAPSDEENAGSIKDRAAPHLDALAALCAEARAKGLQLGFSINPDAFGRFTPQINIVKPL